MEKRNTGGYDDYKNSGWYNRDSLDALNRQQPVHKRIHRVVVRKDPFPRTASGKIQVRQPNAPASAPAPAPKQKKPAGWNQGE